MFKEAIIMLKSEKRNDIDGFERSRTGGETDDTLFIAAFALKKHHIES